MLRLLLPTFFIGFLAAAQPAAPSAAAKGDTIPAAVVTIARATPAAELRRLLSALAAPGMEGRRMATRGDSASARYVATRFTELRLAPPSHRGYYQPISARRRNRSATLTLAGHRYAANEGWSLYPRPDSLQLRNVPIVYAGADSTPGLLRRAPAADLHGKAVLLPATARPGRYPPIDSIETILRGQGAVAVLWPEAATRALRRRQTAAFLPEYENALELPPTGIPGISLAPARLSALLAGENGLQADSSGRISGPRASATFQLEQTLSLEVTTTYSTETAPNVLGVLRGTDEEAACIVVTAHRDHEGLDGKTLYPGAVDNASGTVALVQLANMMQQAVRAGHRPRRSIVFASVTGQEPGMIGSSWYADHPAIPLSKTRAVLNIDMLGRVDTFYRNRRADSNYVYVLVGDSAGIGLMNEVRAANAVFNALRLDDRYARPPGYDDALRGSDHYPFFLKKLPFVYFATGFNEDYHQPTDTPDRINYDLLTRQTQLAFLTLWNMANSKGR